MRLAFDAQRQLGDIDAYIANRGSPDQSRRFAETIENRCLKIGDIPYGGTPRDDRVQDARTIAFRRSPVIVYTVEQDCVVITAALYRGRDVGRHFSGYALTPG